MKNLLFLTTEMLLGGAEKVFYEHIIAFSKHYNVYVCLFDSSHIYEGFRFENRLFQLDDKSFINPAKRWLYRAKRLKQIVQENDIDVCISHMEGPNFLNSFSKAPCKKIVVSHGSIKVNPQKTFWEKIITQSLLIPYLYNRTDKVVAVSSDLAQEHIAAGVSKDKVICIQNFFEIEKILQKAASPTVLDPVFEQANTLINVGRLANQKNQKFLLKLIRYLRDNGRTEKLVLVGDGDLKPELIALAKDLALRVFVNDGSPIDSTADVFFMGAQSNPYPFIIRSKLFVLSSFNEGFPLVLGESLACGVPIVSIDCPTGPRELLAANDAYSDTPHTFVRLACGNLVRYFSDDENNDLNVWKEAIEALLDDDERYQIAKKNCPIKAEQYNLPTIMQQWTRLIE